MKIGAQTYTVRDYCRDVPSLEHSLERIAAAGYSSVQLSGVCEYDPARTDRLLKSLGMTVDLTHFNYQKIISEPKEVIAFHDRMGCKYIGIGSCPHSRDLEGFERMLSELERVLPFYASAGRKIMYHNHNFEFAKFGGVTLFDILCSHADPDRLGITLDAYWAQVGGADAVQLIEKYPEHIRCVHLKDMVYDPTDRAIRMAPVGEGNMNYKAIIAACIKNSVEYAFVEQDNCYGADPFDCLKLSLENINRYNCV